MVELRNSSAAFIFPNSNAVRSVVKRVVTCTFWIVAGLLLVGLAGRLLWFAANTETGLAMLHVQATDATWGWFAGNHTPIHSQEPATQARLWLEEIDHGLARESRDAEWMMGAAIVLDSPSQAYVGKYLKKIQASPVGMIPTMNNDGLRAAENAFETACKVKCLELAARATEIEPDNVHWWRLRALLLWRHSHYSLDNSPRVENWLEVLQEASRHDPDNALYDYLAALFFWDSSAETVYEGAGPQLIVKNAERFARGASHFERGQKKAVLAYSDEGLHTVVEFLQTTKVPVVEHERIVYDRFLSIRRSMLLRDVRYWHTLRAKQAADEGDVRKALAMHRENLRVVNQYTKAGASAEFDEIATWLREGTATQFDLLMRRHEDMFSAAEIENSRVLEENAWLTKKVFQQAARDLAGNRPPPNSAYGSPFDVTSYIVFGVTPSLVVVLILAGLLALGLSRIGGRRELPTVGVAWHSLSLAGAFALTVVVFGLAPVGIIPPIVQNWVLTVLVLVAPVGLVLWIGWAWLRRRAFKFSLRAMLVCVFVFSVLLGIVVAARPTAMAFAQLPFDLSIPARGWNDLDAQSLETVIKPLAIWLWAMFQWVAYQSHYFMFALWAVLVAFVLHFKWRRTSPSSDDDPRTFRNFAGVWARSIGFACLTCSALAAILYLSLAPAVLARTELDFQEKIAFARSPAEHWLKVEAAVKRVRADEKLVEELRAEAVAEIAYYQLNQ